MRDAEEEGGGALQEREWREDDGNHRHVLGRREVAPGWKPDAASGTAETCWELQEAEATSPRPLGVMFSLRTGCSSWASSPYSPVNRTAWRVKRVVGSGGWFQAFWLLVWLSKG